MTLDDAQKTIKEKALEALGDELTQFFNASTGNVAEAPAHFELGLRVLIRVEKQAMEITSRVLGETSDAGHHA